jgi:glycosyltransferase involved in cell wall biosynthesis
MRVLQLPTNIASQVSVNVRALREIGIEARGLVIGNDDIQDPAGIECLKATVSLWRHPIRWTLRMLAARHAVLKAIRWADVVHWHFSWALPNAYDVKYAARLGKAGGIEFWGTDIRKKEIACADNPYWAEMCRLHPELIAGEGASRARQAVFANHGFACLIPGVELDAYLENDLFPTFYRCGTPLILSEYEPRFPDANNKRPVVVHMPSDKARKGTDAVLRAVDELRRTHDFEFRLIHGVKRSEALAIVQSCDIFLDQFVVGSTGFSSREAMALGKPTMCYIKPSLRPKYPPELPIVIASQDNLSAVLKGLLEDGQCRHEIGRQGRAYVEKHHDSRVVAAQLADIYRELLAKSRKRQ